MRKTVVFWMVFCCSAMRLFAQGSQLDHFFEKYNLAEISRHSFAKTVLTAEDCDLLAPSLIDAWQREIYERLEPEMEKGHVRYGDLTMPYADVEYGEVPPEGHSLYISLHGGGATTQQVNDEQWQNQLRLYAPTEGIYVAPRAPWNDWNMWFKPGTDELLERLVQWYVAVKEVNPNRIYLMGYSAGGDGVWRLAPRMADRWAAASMMAGHPGEAQQVNLINLPFIIWMGENDNAYHRNEEARKKGWVMDSLERAEPLTYVHETHIVPGKGHWMDRADTVAVAWMANFERDPLPLHVVWRQEDVVRSDFYWLEVEQSKARPGMRVDVLRNGNKVEILRCDYPKLRIYLNDEMMDLDQNVTVVYRGKVLFDGRLKRTLGTMARTLLERGDYHWMFSTYVDITIQ